MKGLYIIVSTALLLWMCDFAAAGVFTDNGNGTVTDTISTLMWQKQDDRTTKTWEQALTYCEGLSLGGFSDWRLPNIKELRSIVDLSKYMPAIDIVYFPGTEMSSNYWSSSTNASNASYAWLVVSYDGSASSYGKTSIYCVKCVRAGH